MLSGVTKPRYFIIFLALLGKLFVRVLFVKVFVKIVNFVF